MHIKLSFFTFAYNKVSYQQSYTNSDKKTNIMRKETKAASKDVISKVLGGIIIAAGMAYLFFGSQHCDAARFLAMCVCLGAGLKIIEDD